MCIVTLLPFTQKGEFALMLAVRQDVTDFYQFKMSEPPKTGVVSQLVEAGAAMDMQDEVNYSNIIILSTHVVMIALV